VKHVKAEILPTNRKHVPVEVVKFGDTENHSENEKKKIKRRIKKKIKIQLRGCSLMCPFVICTPLQILSF